MAAAFLSVATASAQTLLNEDFEEYATRDTSYFSKAFPTGWTVENSTQAGNNEKYTWSVEVYRGTYPSMSGHAWLYVDAPTYSGDPTGGFGPREEKLISPELNLNSTYQLSFDWKAAAYAVLSSKDYTFQVRVLDGNTETTIFDIQNEQDVRNSGVPADPYGSYIWGNWAVNNSKIDLSAYQGKNVKIEFVYKLDNETGNSLWVDNIKVEQGQSVNSPIAQSSLTQYAFPKMYIGEKFYSDRFTIQNVGKGNLHITGFEAPEGVILNADTANINLAPTETATLQLAYKASLTSPASGNAVIKTNGGDITIPYTATKEAVPDGYTLESFEKFPPAGWTNDGWNSVASYAIEGDGSAYASASLEDMYLVSPRLDLSNASTPHKLTFTYYNLFSSEEGDSYASNDASVWVSTDGGATWNVNDSIWGTVYSDLNAYNSLQTITLDLSKYTSDNVKVRWKMSATPYNSETGAEEFSTFILDRVLLPGVYGLDGVPVGVTYVAPKDSATDVMYKNVTFQWNDAQFADSYKLYVGKSKDNFDVINGLNVGDATSYTAATLPAGTKLYWKVAGTNSVGDETDSPVWEFTTQADQSVSTFPWFEGFEGSSTNLPLGWFAENTSQYSKWYVSDFYPYDGKISATTDGRAVGDVNKLYSPDVTLPADGAYQISFWWGNDKGVNLAKDANNVRTNTFSQTDNNADYGTFEIFADGAWKQLDRISDNSDTHYWVRDAFDLSEYAGKTVQFRWSYGVTNYNRSKGLSLDNVEIKSLAGNNLAFNTTGWDAGKVNYNKSLESDTIALSNLGGSDVTIKNIAFSTDNFTATLADNTVIPAAKSTQFFITFNAKQTAASDSVTVNDTLKVTLTDGSVATLPVKGIALAQDILYFNFEGETPGQVPGKFVGINADNSSSEDFYFWDNAALGLPGYKSFFAVSRDEMPDDGINVIGNVLGNTVLMTRCNTNGAGDDYLVTSTKVGIKSNSSLQFDYRSYETINSILPAQDPSFKVYVSETSNTNTASFTQVGRALNPGLYDESKPWPHANIDLSAYAGKEVYIAIEAVYTNSLGGFLDNVEFDHIDGTALGINAINANANSGLDLNAPMYNLAGQRVSKSYTGIVLQNGRKFIKK